MAVKRKTKKKVAVAKIQFTHRSVLYKLDSKFKGTENETIALINKNLLRWQ